MSWKKYNLGELVYNVSIRAKEIGEFEGLKFLGVSNEDGITESRYAAEDKAEDYKIIEKGCFAYNPYRINVGSIGLMKDETKGLISPAYIVFRLRPNSIIPELLLSFLKSNEGLRQIKINARGTVRQALRFEDLCKIEFSLPSYDEQKVLYKKLKLFEEQGNKQISELTHQLTLLKNLRQQILQDAVQGKLVAQDSNDEPASKLLERIKDEKEQLVKEKKIKKEKPLPPINSEEIPFEIPESWVWCRMQDLCTKITDGTHHSPVNTESGDYMYVTAKNIKENGIDISNITYITKEVHNSIFARCNPNEGDILYIKDGATTGIVTINDFIEEFSLLSSVALLKQSSYVYNRFLMYSMRSPYYYDATRNDMYGVAITRVTLAKIQNSLVALPPLPEQQRIVAKIDQLMKICDELEQSIQQNQQYTQELLQVALREALEPKEKEVEKV